MYGPSEAASLLPKLLPHQPRFAPVEITGFWGVFRGVILLAGLNGEFRVEVEMSGTSKERGAVGFTDLGGLLLNQLLTGGRRSSRNSNQRRTVSGYLPVLNS